MNPNDAMPEIVTKIFCNECKVFGMKNNVWKCYLRDYTTHFSLPPFCVEDWVLWVLFILLGDTQMVAHERL